jgi:hypothetical protein
MKAVCKECGVIMKTVKKGNADLCYDCVNKTNGMVLFSLGEYDILMNCLTKLKYYDELIEHASYLESWLKNAR